jgi:hypothetical protein
LVEQVEHFGLAARLDGVSGDELDLCHGNLSLSG